MFSEIYKFIYYIQIFFVSTNSSNDTFNLSKYLKQTPFNGCMSYLGQTP